MTSTWLYILAAVLIGVGVIILAWVAVRPRPPKDPGVWMSNEERDRMGIPRWEPKEHKP